MNTICIISSSSPAPPHSPLAAVQYPPLHLGAYASRQSRNPSHITTPTATGSSHGLVAHWKQAVISTTPSAAVG